MIEIISEQVKVSRFVTRVLRDDSVEPVGWFDASSLGLVDLANCSAEVWNFFQLESAQNSGFTRSPARLCPVHPLLVVYSHEEISLLSLDQYAIRVLRVRKEPAVAFNVVEIFDRRWLQAPVDYASIREIASFGQSTIVLHLWHR